ncbi:MAG: hypothetical protein M3384_09220 [Acidobacteriota bacterium]|nr:hypothetical protein [Acidobacteriota bacterium]
MTQLAKQKAAPQNDIGSETANHATNDHNPAEPAVRSGNETKSDEKTGRLLSRIQGRHHKPLPQPLDKEKSRKLEWEMDKHLSLFKDYFDYAIKIVGIFAAIVGGILTIAYSTQISLEPEAKKILLTAIVVMSYIMGGIFMLGAVLWYLVVTEMKWIARQIEMIKLPAVGYLSLLLVIFSFLFFAFAFALSRLR